MQVSNAGRRLIEFRESPGGKPNLTSYKDIRGIWTVGFGHTGSNPTPRKGLSITPREADEIMQRDLAWVEAEINRDVKVPLTQWQFDALASLVFNIGVYGFRGSHVLYRLNRSEYSQAADAFLMWEKPAALKSRRESERRQFLGEQP